jgi:hypothetical protein
LDSISQWIAWSSSIRQPENSLAIDLLQSHTIRLTKPH